MKDKEISYTTCDYHRDGQGCLNYVDISIQITVQALIDNNYEMLYNEIFDSIEKIKEKILDNIGNGG